MVQHEKSAFSDLDGIDIVEEQQQLESESDKTANANTELVEVERVISEKEGILTKLLDTVRSYAAMKSDFERLLDSIGTLETERQQLEAELEKAKTEAQQAHSQSQTQTQSTVAVDRLKER
jgi:chromosome segregation ATPase